jgi:hypothetical protein
MFVVSGCQQGSNVSYYLNAIDITKTTTNDLMMAQTGQTLGQAGGLLMTAPTVFRPQNQFQRPALLLTHTTNAQGQITGTYLYVSFGTGTTELGSGTTGYNGWVFGYSIGYTGSSPSQPTSVTATPLTGSPFSTTPSNLTTGVYPAASGLAPGLPSGWPGYPPHANPSCTGNCFEGDDWIDSTNVTGHGGGVWMSGRGPSSDYIGNVYFGAGNGSFGCTTSGSTCTSASALNNFGESATELTAASVSPADFYAPYTNHAVNDQPANGNPFSAAGTQVEALNRYDLDFGTPGVILFDTFVNSGAQNWLTTADKTGYVYVMPTLSSGSGSSGMGQFRTGDSGLTSGSYTTQAPFQMSRLPASTGTTGICPAPAGSTSPDITSANCDQIMGFAWWNNYLFAWPWNEAVIGRQGTVNAGPPINYQFSTVIDPCSPNITCTNFPAGGTFGALAIAANAISSATLWGTRYNFTSKTGELWAWVINTGPASLTNIFNPTMSTSNAANCTGLPTLPSSWVPSEFAEPTLVNGTVYAPAAAAYSSGTTLKTGGGVLVFGVCQ